MSNSTIIRAKSELKLSNGKVNLTITYAKGLALINLFTDILPILITDVGADKLRKMIEDASGNND